MKAGNIYEPASTPVEPGENISNIPPVGKDEFFPGGAIAFFISLVALCLIIWFGIYFIMLNRI